MRRSRLLLFLLPLLLFGSSNYPAPPATKKQVVVDTIHGFQIADPYRWLENQNSPETRKWIDAQNAFAEKIVGQNELRSRIQTRLSELMRFDEATGIKKGGAWEYYTYARADFELPVICRRAAPPEGTLRPTTPGDCEVVIDPNSMSSDHTTKVELLSVSPNGNLVVYGVHDGGQDELEIHVRDAEQKIDLPDRFPNALYDDVAFNKTGESFYYAIRSRETGPRIRIHTIGKPIASDRELFGANCDPTEFLDFQEVADGKYLLITLDHGWQRTELYLKDLHTEAPVRTIASDADGRFYPSFDSGRLFVRTNFNAPMNRLLAIDLEHPEQSNWKDVLPEAQDTLSDFMILDQKIFATYLHNVDPVIKIFTLDGAPAGQIELPAHSGVELHGATKGKVFITISSFQQPPITYLVDLSSGTRTLWDRRKIPFDGSDIVVDQEWCASKDGTRVPMYIVHKKNVEMNDHNPTLLYGYGGFYVSLTPMWDASAAFWVENGGVFAMANMRGGSEFGEQWHRGGMLQNKQHVFDDFIAAAEKLIALHYTNPNRLAIRGISNGGLLMGSVLTQRPDLFRAVLCAFPDLDMVRFNTFSKTNNIPALLEYGNASVADQFQFLRKYSPYQAVKDGTRYPAAMISSGDLDTRVPPLQARKFTARLQAATTSGLPIILRYHPKAGHAVDHGLPLSQNIEDAAMQLTFLLEMLNNASN